MFRLSILKAQIKLTVRSNTLEVISIWQNAHYRMSYAEWAQSGWCCVKGQEMGCC